MLSSLVSWRKGNKDHRNCLQPQREVESRDKFRVAGPQTAKASPHSARLHHLAGRGAKDSQTPLISVMAACAQHPPRAGTCGCGRSLGYAAQLSVPAALLTFLSASLKSICLTPAFLFCCVRWNYSPNYGEKNWESNLSLNSNKSQEPSICDTGSPKCLILDPDPRCLLLPIMKVTMLILHLPPGRIRNRFP